MFALFEPSLFCVSASLVSYVCINFVFTILRELYIVRRNMPISTIIFWNNIVYVMQIACQNYFLLVSMYYLNIFQKLTIDFIPKYFITLVLFLVGFLFSYENLIMFPNFVNKWIAISETESAFRRHAKTEACPFDSIVIKCNSSICEVTCAICLENIKQNKLYKKLKCSHMFHKECVDEWFLISSSSCPLCRTFIKN